MNKKSSYAAGTMGVALLVGYLWGIKDEPAPRIPDPDTVHDGPQTGSVDSDVVSQSQAEDEHIDVRDVQAELPAATLEVPVTESPASQRNLPLSVQFVRSYGGFSSRFASMADDLIANEDVDPVWAAESLDTIRQRVSAHFADYSFPIDDLSECLTSICYVDTSFALSGSEASEIWRVFADQWEGDELLEETAVLYRLENDFYRMYFFRKGFSVSQ